MARVEDFGLADLDRAWLLEHRLDRRSAMRGTFHLFTAERLADVICAFGTQRVGEYRPLREARIAPAEAQALSSALASLLDHHGPLDLAGLKRALPASLRARAAEKTAQGSSALSVVVRWMTEAGVLAQTFGRDGTTGSALSGWARAPRAYERFEAIFGRVAPCTREEADLRFAEWYFTAHGPAAYEDWAWWTGFPAARSRAAFEAVRSGLVEIEVPGWTERVYAPPEAPAIARSAPLGSARAPSEGGPVVRLLPYEDAAIKAYRATRHRFFEAGGDDRHHTRYGEVLPAVLLDGKIVGTWSPGPRGRGRTFGPESGPSEPQGPTVELYTTADRVVEQGIEAELARVRAAVSDDRPGSR